MLQAGLFLGKAPLVTTIQGTPLGAVESQLPQPKEANSGPLISVVQSWALNSPPSGQTKRCLLRQPGWWKLDSAEC